MMTYRPGHHLDLHRVVARCSTSSRSQEPEARPLGGFLTKKCSYVNGNRSCTCLEGMFGLD